MTLAEFEASLGSGLPPEGIDAPLAALWWDRKGDWQKAHVIAAADETSRDAAWVHAYLHRREGDAGNARYWYRPAERPVAGESLDQEWASLAGALLAR